MLVRPIHPHAWRGCPKRGANNAPSMDVAAIRRANGPKIAFSEVRRAGP
jgi:hypothetical protein